MNTTMNIINLTSAQVRVLTELRKPGVYAFYLSNPRRRGSKTYWYLQSNQESCTKQIDALFALGFINITMRDGCKYSASAKVAP